MDIEDKLLKINLLDVVNHIKNKIKKVKREDIKVYLSTDKDENVINIKSNKPYNHVFQYRVDNNFERMIFLNSSIDDLYFRIIHAYDVYLFENRSKKIEE